MKRTHKQNVILAVSAIFFGTAGLSSVGFAMEKQGAAPASVAPPVTSTTTTTTPANLANTQPEDVSTPAAYNNWMSNGLPANLKTSWTNAKNSARNDLSIAKKKWYQMDGGCQDEHGKAAGQGKETDSLTCLTRGGNPNYTIAYLEQRNGQPSDSKTCVLLAAIAPGNLTDKSSALKFTSKSRHTNATALFQAVAQKCAKTVTTWLH